MSEKSTVRLEIPTVRFSFSSNKPGETVHQQQERHQSSSASIAPAISPTSDAPVISPASNTPVISLASDTPVISPASAAPVKKPKRCKEDHVRRRSTRLIPPVIELPAPPPELSCTICSSSFVEADGFVDIQRATLYALCMHLNIVEQFFAADTPEGSNDAEYSKFPQCFRCHELVMFVAALNTQLETIYSQICGVIDEVKTAISNGYSTEELCTTSDGFSSIANEEVDSVRHFRSLVLQNGGFITTNEISVEMMPMQNAGLHEGEDLEDDEDMPLEYDLAGLEETINSQNTGGNRNLTENGFNSSLPAVSPSPAFSPLSVRSEDLDWSSASFETNSRVMPPEKESMQQITKKKVGRPRKNPTTQQRGKCLTSTSPVKLSSSKIKLIQKRNAVVIPADVPSGDHECYRVMKSLGIQYKRPKLSIYKANMTDKDYIYYDKKEGRMALCRISPLTLNTWRNKAKQFHSTACIYDVLNTESGDEDDDRLVLPSRGVCLSSKKTVSDKSVCSTSDFNKSNCEPEADAENDIPEIVKIVSKTKSTESATKVQLSTGSNSTSSFKKIPIQESPSGSLLCVQCKKRFASFSELMSHVKDHHKSTSKKINEDKTKLKKYYGKTEIKALESGTFKYKCGKCGELASSEKAVITHIKLFHKERSTNSNSAPASVSKDTINPITRAVVIKNGRLYYGGNEIIKTGENNFKCSVCQKIFMRLSGIQNHMRLIHNNEAIKKGSINFKPNNSLFKIQDIENGCKSYGSFRFQENKEGQCRCLSSSCNGKWFISREEILRHIRETHLKLFKPALPKTTSKKIRIKSVKHDDGRVFHRGVEMLRTEDGKHKCGDCSNIFSSVSNLMVHIARRHHAIQNPFICQYCGRTFAYKFMLTQHEVAHESEPSYMCEKCGKSFRFPSSLNHHIRHIHELVTRFTCKTCGKKFYGRADFRRHKESHLNQQQKPSEQPNSISESSKEAPVPKPLSESTAESPESPLITFTNIANTLLGKTTGPKNDDLISRIDEDEPPPPILKRFDEVPFTSDSSVESPEPPVLILV